MRFTTAIVFAFVAFTSNQVLAAYIPADGESVDAHGVHGHRRHWESLAVRDMELETRDMQLLQARACQMTSKPKRNCNINTCRAGGGRCAPAGASGRCSGKNMWGASAPFECSTNCKCETF